MGLTDEQISGIMKENGKDVEAAKARFADYDSLKEQLSKASQTIDGFKAMDIDGIKKAAVESRRDQIADQKRSEPNLGVRWDPQAFDEALDRVLSLDTEYRSLERQLGTLQTKYEFQSSVLQQASADHEMAALRRPLLQSLLFLQM